MKIFSLVVFFSLTATCFVLAVPFPVPTNLKPQILRDPKTKVIYFLDTDRRHVTAISPDGKILWNCEVIPDGAKEYSYVENISFGEKGVDVTIWVVGQTNGTINPTTGVLWRSPLVQ